MTKMKKANKMNKKALDEYRDRVDSRLEELTIMSAKQNGDIANIKDDLVEIKDLLRNQNGRVRYNERAISRMQGIGSVLDVVFASFIGWLFRMKG